MSGGIRLNASISQNLIKGEIQVYIAEYKEWYDVTACDNNWDIKEATVACRQLGFDYVASSTLSNTHYSRYGYFLKNLTCDGTETSLFDCAHNELERHYCSRNQATTVTCGIGRLYTLSIL